MYSFALRFHMRVVRRDLGYEMNNTFSLRQLGWQPFFQQQLNLTELELCNIARVTAHHRTHYNLQTEQQQVQLPISVNTPELTVGDWVLLDQAQNFIRNLERKSLFKRKAPGQKVSEQLIAANVDTLFIVCSLNQDFNLNRIERFLALAYEAMVEPVVVLTKKDLCDQAETKKQQVQDLDRMLAVEVVNGLDKTCANQLMPWCSEGKTLSLIGSSGVGKSTLANLLLGKQEQGTAAIRESDSKGRHTTRVRQMHFLPTGSALIDMPGMRELQLTECEDGVQHTFADIDELTHKCKFSDCSHVKEPGCAIKQAITDGRLAQRRFDSYKKLQQEQARNSATLKQKRDKEKAFSQFCKVTMADSIANKRGY